MTWSDPALSTGVTIVAVLGLLEFYAMFWPGWSMAGWKIYNVAMAAGYRLGSSGLAGNGSGLSDHAGCGSGLSAGP